MKYYLVPFGPWTLSSPVGLLNSLPVGSLFPYFCQNNGGISCTHSHHSNIYSFMDSVNSYLVPTVYRLDKEGKLLLTVLRSNILGLEEAAFKG